MTEHPEQDPEVLTVDDDLDWQRGDAPVSALAAPQDVEEGNRQGKSIDVDDDKDNGL